LANTARHIKIYREARTTILVYYFGKNKKYEGEAEVDVYKNRRGG